MCAVLILLLSGAMAHAQTFNPLNGPWGNRIYGITSNASGDLFVGTQNWLWKYSGGSWTKIQLNPNPLITSSPYGGTGKWKPIVRNGSVLLYTDDQLRTDNYVWRSTDNGATWNSVVQSGLPGNSAMNCLALDTNDAVLAGLNGTSSNAGVYRSTNNGSTWTSIGLSSVQVWSITVRSDGYIFLGTGDGVYRSTNHGSSWSQSNTGLTNTTVVSVALNSSEHVFAGTFDGVFKSTDDGASWSRVDAGFTNTLVWCLAIESDGDVYAGTVGGGVYKSTNGGSSWGAVNSGFMSGLSLGLDMQALFATASGDVYAGTYVDGVFKTTNGGASWTQFGTPVDVRSVITKGSNIFVNGDVNRIFRSTNNGSSWSRLEQTTTGAFMKQSGDLFAGTSTEVVKSTNNGSTWLSSGSGLPGTSVLSLERHPDGDLFAGTAAHGVYKSTNNGASWTQVYANAQTVWSLAIVNDGSYEGDVFVGTSGSSFQTPSGVFRSENDGNTGTYAYVGLSQYTITSLSTNNNGRVLAGTYDGVWRSRNNGNTWELLSNTPAKTERSPNAVSSLSDVLVIAATDSSPIFAGTNGSGLFRSPDSGDTWVSAGTGIADFTTSAITFDDSGHVVVGTGSGIFISEETLSDMIPPIAPALDAPASATEQVPIATTVYWSATPSALTYHVQVSTDSLFATTVANESGITDTSEIVGGLENFTKYFWRVRATNDWGTGIWSDVWSFTTIVAAPAQPTLASPANGAGTIPINTSLEWNSDEFAETYHVQVALDDLFASPLVDTSGVTDTSLSLSGLDSALTYYWRVNATNVGGTSNWSGTWNFTTTLYAFTYLLEDGWNMISIPFNVSDGNPDVLFPEAVSNAFEYSGGYMTANPLRHGKGYWVKFNDSTSAIIAGTPVMSDTINVVYGWNLVGAIADPVDVTAIESNPPNIVTSTFWGYSGGSYFVADTLYPGHAYWVKVNNGGTLMIPFLGAGAENKIRIVKTGEVPPPPPGDGVTNSVPSKFQLYQNYPNPFNPTTMIRFDLPQAAIVHFTVTNVLGQEVLRTVREYLAGRNEAELDMSSLPSGIYLYKIEAGSFTSVRRMVFLK